MLELGGVARHPHQVRRRRTINLVKGDHGRHHRLVPAEEVAELRGLTISEVLGVDKDAKAEEATEEAAPNGQRQRFQTRLPAIENCCRRTPRRGKPRRDAATEADELGRGRRDHRNPSWLTSPRSRRRLRGHC